MVSRLDQKYFVPKFAHGDVVEELRHATQDPIKRIAHDAENLNVCTPSPSRVVGCALCSPRCNLHVSGLVETGMAGQPQNHRVKVPRQAVAHAHRLNHSRAASLWNVSCTKPSRLCTHVDDM